MKLAQGTSWLVFTAAVWAAPRPVHRGLPVVDGLADRDVRRADDDCATQTGGSSNCLTARQAGSELHLSTTFHAPDSTTTSSFSSTSASIAPSASSITTIPLTSTSQSIPSSATPHSLDLNNKMEAQSNSSSNANPSNDQLRTVGIIGGFLAGIAFVAIIGIMLILIRNQRRRGSTASSSTRSRTRTNSRIQPVPFMVQQLGEPVMRPPQLRILTTGDGVTAVSHDMTTAGTLGHHSMGLHQFPTTGYGSASSHTTSYGQHSSDSAGPSVVPRRAPQIPSLGLSQPRPLLRSFGSIISYHASTGHPTTPGHEVQVQTQPPISPPAPSIVELKTIAATEDVVRSEENARTEETAQTAQTAVETLHTEETAPTVPVEVPAGTSSKPEQYRV